MVCLGRRMVRVPLVDDEGEWIVTRFTQGVSLRPRFGGGRTQYRIGQLEEALAARVGDTHRHQFGRPRLRVLLLRRADDLDPVAVRVEAEGEVEACRRLAAQTSDDKLFFEDVLWSLFNSKHFLFVR